MRNDVKVRILAGMYRRSETLYVELHTMARRTRTVH